jgi:hypothetical protein
MRQLAPIGCAELRFAPVPRRGLIENDDAIKALRAIEKERQTVFLLILFKIFCVYSIVNQSVILQNAKFCGTFCGTLQKKKSPKSHQR